jgi:hypothetical protein
LDLHVCHTFWFATILFPSIFLTNISFHLVHFFASALVAGGFAICTTPATLHQLQQSHITFVPLLFQASSGSHIIISFMQCPSS